MNRFERLIAWFAPKWGEQRARARLMVRHYESASSGRRTSGWHRGSTDANTAASGATLLLLRAQARDLVRNNPYARRGLRRIFTSTVGWGIRPKAIGRNAARIMELWKRWGETTQCDASGRLTFYGLQRLVMRTVVESGEVLIRRRWRRPGDGLAIPLQLQVIEPDLIDSAKDGMKGEAGGRIIQGVEFDAIGRRVAYWLFDQHPGSRSILASPVSRRIPADSIIHVYDQERAGQVRGASWFASVDVRLHEFDEFEDATLMKQKIASCMAAFVTDVDGTGPALGEAGVDAKTGQPMDTLEPGMIMNLPVGKQVTVANPPQASDHQSFSTAVLRGVAAGLGVTYEDLTGDYSQVNYSSARMARLAHTADVNDWRWNMLIPQFCAPAWAWVVEALQLAGEDVDDTPAEWTPPPAQMLDPDKEGTAMSRNVRAGVMTHDEMVREQGYDPDAFWQEYADGLERLDRLGIILDSDPRKTTSSGQLQAAPAETKTTDETKKTDEADADEAAERQLDKLLVELRAREAALMAQVDWLQRQLETHRASVEALQQQHDRAIEAVREDWKRCARERERDIEHERTAFASALEHEREAHERLIADQRNLIARQERALDALDARIRTIEAAIDEQRQPAAAGGENDSKGSDPNGA